MLLQGLVNSSVMQPHSDDTGKESEEKYQKCQKCKKPMKFAHNFDRIIRSTVPPEQQDTIIGMLVMCETCKQPYRIVKKNKSVKFVLLTQMWLKTRSKKEQKYLKEVITVLEKNMNLLSLSTYWVKRFLK